MLLMVLAVLGEHLTAGDHHVRQLLNSILHDLIPLSFCDEVLDFEVLLRVEGSSAELNLVNLFQMLP